MLQVVTRGLYRCGRHGSSSLTDVPGREKGAGIWRSSSRLRFLKGVHWPKRTWIHFDLPSWSSWSHPDFGFALRLETFLSWSLLTFWCHLSASDAAWIFWNLLKSSMWFQALESSPLQKCWDKKVARKLLRPLLVNTEFVQLICFVLKLLFLLSNRRKTLVLSKSFYLWLFEHLRSNSTKLKGNSIICRLSADYLQIICRDVHLKTVLLWKPQWSCQFVAQVLHGRLTATWRVLGRRRVAVSWEPKQKLMLRVWSCRKLRWDKSTPALFEMEPSGLVELHKCLPDPPCHKVRQRADAVCRALIESWKAMVRRNSNCFSKIWYFSGVFHPKGPRGLDVRNGRVDTAGIPTMWIMFSLLPP